MSDANERKQREQEQKHNIIHDAPKTERQDEARHGRLGTNPAPQTERPQPPKKE